MLYYRKQIPENSGGMGNGIKLSESDPDHCCTGDRIQYAQYAVPALGLFQCRQVSVRIAVDHKPGDARKPAADPKRKVASAVGRCDVSSLGHLLQILSLPLIT